MLTQNVRLHPFVYSGTPSDSKVPTLYEAVLCVSGPLAMEILAGTVAVVLSSWRSKSNDPTLRCNRPSGTRAIGTSPRRYAKRVGFPYRKAYTYPRRSPSCRHRNRVYIKDLPEKNWRTLGMPIRLRGLLFRNHVLEELLQRERTLPTVALSLTARNCRNVIKGGHVCLISPVFLAAIDASVALLNQK